MTQSQRVSVLVMRGWRKSTLCRRRFRRPGGVCVCVRVSYLQPLVCKREADWPSAALHTGINKTAPQNKLTKWNNKDSAACERLQTVVLFQFLIINLKHQMQHFSNPSDSVHPGKSPEKMFGKGRILLNYLGGDWTNRLIQSAPIRFMPPVVG